MKKYAKGIGLIIASALLLGGCGSLVTTIDSVSVNAETEVEDITEQETVSDDEITQELSAEEEGSQESDAATDTAEEINGDDAEEPAQSRAVTIYYIDAVTAELVSKTVEIEDEYDIWAALKDTEMLAEECELLGFAENEDGKLDLDFNSGTGDWIRGFGTTGETEILTCLINTYLDAYDCEKIRLTEEGGTFETSSGANYEGYTGKLEF